MSATRARFRNQGKTQILTTCAPPQLSNPLILIHAFLLADGNQAALYDPPLGAPTGWIRIRAAGSAYTAHQRKVRENRLPTATAPQYPIGKPRKAMLPGSPLVAAWFARAVFMSSSAYWLAIKRSSVRIINTYYDGQWQLMLPAAALASKMLQVWFFLWESVQGFFFSVSPQLLLSCYSSEQVLRRICHRR